MQTMSRFSAIVLALWAGSAQAERWLEPQEIMALTRENAVCYQDAQGGCYSAEFFKNIGPDTMDVTYTYEGNDGISVVTERVFWDGNKLCVQGDSSGVLRAGVIAPPDQMFRFDLSNVVETTGRDLEDLKTAYDAREAGYCYGWKADGDGYENMRTVYGTSGGTAPLRLIPLSFGSIQLN